MVNQTKATEREKKKKKKKGLATRKKKIYIIDYVCLNMRLC